MKTTSHMKATFAVTSFERFSTWQWLSVLISSQCQTCTVAPHQPEPKAASSHFHKGPFEHVTVYLFLSYSAVKGQGLLKLSTRIGYVKMIMEANVTWFSSFLYMSFVWSQSCEGLLKHQLHFQPQRPKTSDCMTLLFALWALHPLPWPWHSLIVRFCLRKVTLAWLHTSPTLICILLLTLSAEVKISLLPPAVA